MIAQKCRPELSLRNVFAVLAIHLNLIKNLRIIIVVNDIQFEYIDSRSMN